MRQTGILAGLGVSLTFIAICALPAGRRDREPCRFFRNAIVAGWGRR